MNKIKSNVPSIPMKDYLKKSHEKFKSELEKRILLGEELLDRKIENIVDLAKLKEEYGLWNNYNAELLKQSFNNTENSYYKEYVYTGRQLYTSNAFDRPTLNDLVNETLSSIDNQFRRLKKIYNKIDILEIDPILKSTDIESKTGHNALVILNNLFLKFHKVAQTLRYRYSDRETIVIKDEYDVQDLLRSLLKINFEDIREEEFAPSYAGANSRIDFVLKNENIIIETKMTNNKLKDGEIGKQLLVDIGRYKSYPNCNTLIVFIYDKDDHIINKIGLKKDLENMSTNELIINVHIQPQ